MERSDEVRRLDSLYDRLSQVRQSNRELEVENKQLKDAVQPILEGSVKMPPFEGETIESIEFFGELHLDKPENAYHFGWETAMLECGEIIAKALKG